MPKHTANLKKGKTFADVLDGIEAGIVEYMRAKRKIDEASMRQLLDKDAEVRASYNRKVQRTINSLIARGVHPSCFTY